MSIKQTMLLNDCRWIGGAGISIGPHRFDHSGRATAIDAPCSISIGAPLVGGDHPIKFCQASRDLGGELGRVLLDNIAAFSPFDFQFMMHSQPDGIHEAGKVQYGDRWLVETSEIYDFIAQEVSGSGGNYGSFIDPPGPHCERLGFYSNVSRKFTPPARFSRWMKPGGAQANVPPVEFEPPPSRGGLPTSYKALWARVGGQNICLGLVKRTVNMDPVEVIDAMPMQQGLVETAPILHGHQTGNVVKPATQVCGVGHNDPLLDTEVWGGFAPTISARQGDTRIEFGQDIDFHGFDRFRYKWLESGEIVLGPWYETPESVRGDYDFQIPVGEFDWRFLFAVVERNVRTCTREMDTWKLRHHLMYWDLRSGEGAPTGVGPEGTDADLQQFILNEIIPRVEASAENRGRIQGNTVFDIRIQAAVRSCKCRRFTALNTDYNGVWILWDKCLADDWTAWVYIWSHTNFLISVRQAMPIPYIKP